MKEAEANGAFRSYGWIRKAYETVGVELERTRRE
jgi:hypothetical protein